jgi:Protein of unknown function (DUF3313)
VPIGAFGKPAVVLDQWSPRGDGLASAHRHSQEATTMNSRLITILALSFVWLAAPVGADEAPPGLRIAAPVDASAYTKVLIDDVRVVYDEASPYRKLKPAQAKRINEAALEAIRAAIGQRYAVVDAPGPDVLRVRAAIIDVQAIEKPKRFWSYTPFGFIKGRIDAATGRNFVLLAAQVDVRLLDSVTDAPLAAVADLAVGSGNPDELSFRTLIQTIGGFTHRLVGEVAALSANTR